MSLRDKTILLVEDNPADEELTLLSFKENNISNRIIVARDGQEALDYLFATGPYKKHNIKALPQLIILDLKLPKIDGLEVLKRVRENDSTKLVPVVVLTSSSAEEDIIKAYSFGTNAYVRKPVDFNHFIVAIRNLGMFWLLLNETAHV